MVKKKVNLLMFLCLVLVLTFQGATLANANQKEFILSHIMPQDHFPHHVKEAMGSGKIVYGLENHKTHAVLLNFLAEQFPKAVKKDIFPAAFQAKGDKNTSRN